MEKLRQIGEAVSYVRQWMDDGKPLACMCSGVQLLITAQVVRGRTLTCYPAFAIDATNAGAKYVTDPVVVDGNLVTSPHYQWLGEWMAAAIRVVSWVNSSACAHKWPSMRD